MRRSRLCSIVLTASTGILSLAAFFGCATSPTDASPDPETRSGEVTVPPREMPGASDPGSSPSGEDTDGGGAVADGGGVLPDGATGTPDAGIDGALLPRTVVIKIVPTRSDWLVAGQPAPILVQADAKNCNLFGNNCDADVDLTIAIDAPATTLATSASCSRVQAGTGARQCTQGTVATKTAVLTPGDDVKVRFHAEAVDDPGSNPSCNIDKTWTFTGTGFTLKGETAPASGYWQCIGGGSGQNLDVLLGYKLAM